MVSSGVVFFLCRFWLGWFCFVFLFFGVCYCAVVRPDEFKILFFLACFPSRSGVFKLYGIRVFLLTQQIRISSYASWSSGPVKTLSLARSGFSSLFGF